MNEVTSFVRGGPERPEHHPDDGQMGHPRPGDPAHSIYVWFDALHNYVTGIGYDRDPALFQKVLAGFRPSDRQGHPPLPCRFLAGVPHGLGPAPSRVRLRPWLVAQGRSQDVQIEGQRPGPLRPHPGHGARSAPVFPPAGNPDRAGRQLQPRGLHPSGQFRPGQRPGKPGQPDADDDPATISRGPSPSPRPRNRPTPQSGRPSRRRRNGRSPTTRIYALNKALEEIWAFVTVVNKYLADNAPWKLHKDPALRPRLARVLPRPPRRSGAPAPLIAPVMPGSAQKIWEFLGESGRVLDVKLDSLSFDAPGLGQAIKSPGTAFPRVDLKEFLAEETSPKGIRHGRTKTRRPRTSARP